MHYETMFPDQIRSAIDENTPVVLPVGTLEYHSEHLPPGVDTLLVVRALEELAGEMPLVILPPFYYGAGSFVVESPERNGTFHVDAEVLHAFARQVFYNLLRIGFRNVRVVVHHQTENFAEGMPTDLAFKLAARQEIFAFLERERGESWWGDESSADYYESHAEGENPFNWIRVHPFMDEAAQARFPIDHAGKQETSLMMAFCPECVDMGRFSDEKWYSRGAQEASEEYSLEAKVMVLDGLRRALGGG